MLLKKIRNNANWLVLGFCLTMAASVTALAEIGPTVPVPTVAAPAPVATFAPAPAAVPAIGGGVLAWLQNLIGFQVPGWVATVSVFFLTEVFGRVIKTQVPFSLFYFLRDLCSYLAIALHAVAVFLDGVLQNSTQDSNPPKNA